jgi:hypothetical protein
MVMAGAENTSEGYSYYEKYGMVLLFDNYADEKPWLIECYGDFEINGAKVGMTFDEILEFLPEGEMFTYSPIGREDLIFYGLMCDFDGFGVLFYAYADEHAGTVKMHIDRNDYGARSQHIEEESAGVDEHGAFQSNLEGLIDLFGLTKKEILDKLGEDYDIIRTGPDGGSYRGYSYSEWRMTIVFKSLGSDGGDDDRIAYIECRGEMSDINGARVGMTFEEIKGFLPEGEVFSYTHIDRRDEPYYSFRYVYDGYMIDFDAQRDESGETISFVMENKDW